MPIKSKRPSNVVLEQMYVREQMTPKAIGALFGVTATQVSRWLRQAKISTRSPSEAGLIAVRPQEFSAEARAKWAENAKKAREKLTPESRKKQSASMKGKTPHNKGKKWTSEERAAHMAVRTSAEYREKHAVKKRGEANGMWRGGTQAEKDRWMSTWEWRLVRQQCYERDQWLCQDCGVKCWGKKQANSNPHRRIQAHHIISRRNGGTHELSNLVTLCASCHHKRESKYKDALFG